MNRRAPRFWLAAFIAVTTACTLFGAAADARLNDDAGVIVDASASEAFAEADASNPDQSLIERKTVLVRDLVEGHLNASIDARSLFDISIADESAVDLERTRLVLLLRNAPDVDASVAAWSSFESGKKENRGPANRDASREIANTKLLASRFDLDRARLSFYVLSATARNALLAAHEAALLDGSVLPEADQRAHEAEVQREAALRAAEDAKSEAQRLVATEYVRLLAVETAQTQFDSSLEKARQEIAARREETLGLQRRAREAHDAASTEQSADTTYDDLRRALRGARSALSLALDAVSSSASDVPQPGPDALADPQIDVDTTDARAERKRVETEAIRLTSEERKLRDEQAGQLLDEIDTLNRERLALLDVLSPAKRSAITGFSSAGFDQAASELRQLTLVLRYHRYVVTGWITSLGHSDRALAKTLGDDVVGIVEGLLLFAGFFWWRRRSNPLFRAWRARAHESDRIERLATPSLGTRVLTFASQTHNPLEWLLFLLLLTWLLPSSVQNILEVRVISSIITWTFGAAFVVDSINAFASSDRSGASEGSTVEVATLRLRSLRLVGRTVVVFGLVLVISSMVVGRGTIYSWVFSTCWLASIPILLLLVRWWRAVVFRRTDLVRKKSAFQKWVLANRNGWSSFPAATAGGVHLFVIGTIRVTRNWVSRFDITRRFLAYLFRRELTKLGTDQPQFAVQPIDERAFAELGPEVISTQWVATDLEEPLTQLMTRIRERRGGVIAIVGERGLGKTSVLRRIKQEDASAISIETPTTDLAELRRLLAKSVAIDAAATLEDAAKALDESGSIHAVLLDDANHFVRPLIGGLAAFDALLAAASKHCTTTTWVFTLDAVIWQFLERSRGARPMFDDVIRIAPWREEEIVTLLRSRTEQAAITPSFEHLLDRLPANADEVDKQEAITQRARDYYRLLWDYAYGNPAVALHMWRRSLGVDATGATAVRLFTAMDTSDLERLPDRAVFVLRAVLQLSPAHPTQIAQATMLRAADVADALRYALSRNYIEQHGETYSVTWTWFRALTLFLQRRHLLVLR